jgi:tetratricopeptide (TPR) repeat protein
MRRPGTKLLAATLGALSLAACIPEEPAPAPKAAPADAGPGSLDATDAKGLLKTVESMKEALKGKARDFGVNVALGNLFYDNGRYIEALEYYRDALRQAVEAERRVLELSKVTPDKTTPPECRIDEPTEAERARGEKARSFESVWAGLQAQTPADGGAAAACARQLVPFIAQLHARNGNAWYLVGNGEKAREAHDAALALDPDQPEALFFRGAHTLESAKGDAAKLAAGKATWERLLKVAPEHPRATIVRETLPRIDELFGAARPAGPMAGHPPVASGTAPSGGTPQGPAPLPPGMAEAMQRVEVTPEMAKGLDQQLEAGEALLAKGAWQEALDTFKQVMPLRPDGRVALGMGVALRELGKPTAERVLMQATRMPGGDLARAHFELGRFYEKSDPAKAKAEYAQVPPASAYGAKAKARLAELK